jgi:low affinity Fe/Cu permease
MATVFDKDPNHWLEKFSHWATQATGSTVAFVLAVLTVVVWVVTGPLFQFSDTWQLVINTGTTIVTFLMVFLIQRTQNKDSLATQLKLNEILAALKGASNRLINVEDLDEDEVRRLHARYQKLADRARCAKDPCARHTIEEEPAPDDKPPTETDRELQSV